MLRITTDSQFEVILSSFAVTFRLLNTGPTYNNTRIQINPEIRIRKPDHFWSRLDALENYALSDCYLLSYKL